MHWIAWVAMPLPLLSLATLIYALARRDADPKQRARMAVLSGAALLLGVVLVVLASMR